MTDTAPVTEAEWADFWDSPDLLPVRTATACNAINCRCNEWSDGPIISGYRCCHSCSHTSQSHLPRTASKQTKRNGGLR